LFITDQSGRFEVTELDLSDPLINPSKRGGNHPSILLVTFVEF